MRIFLYFLIGAVLFGLFLKFSIGGVKRMAKFLMIYDTDDPDTKKHSGKAMFVSLIIYFVILFVLAVLTTYNIIMGFVMVPAWLFTFYFTSHYIKLWKFQGNSVLLLIFLTLVVLIGSFALSPIVKEGLTAAVDFLRSLL